jgi:uroporphyrinogen-III synthase
MLCSFGPETSKTLLENDLEVSLEIENPSVDSMVDALVQKFGNH